VRIGIVGLGYWGQKYLRLVQESSEAELIAACDASDKLLVHAHELYPHVRATNDAAALVTTPDIDAVVIATPATTHFELVAAALNAGKHVLCEKPLTMRTDESLRLIELAGEVDRTLFVGHTFIYNPGVRAARDFVAAGTLGDALHLHGVWAAPGPVRHDVSALWDLAPHPISIIAYVLGRSPQTVRASEQSILPSDHADVAFVNLRFDDRISADVHLTWLAPRKVRSVTMTGDRRIAIFDDMEPADKLQIFDTHEALEVGSPVAVSAERTTALPTMPVHIPAIPRREPLAAQFAHFIESCREGVTPDSDGSAGTEVVRILEAADESIAAGGRTIDLSADEAMLGARR
jgi:predicted dehydrogenase